MSMLSAINTLTDKIILIATKKKSFSSNASMVFYGLCVDDKKPKIRQTSGCATGKSLTL